MECRGREEADVIRFVLKVHQWIDEPGRGR